MNSTLSKVLIFTAGAVIGSAVTCKFLKTKYERLAEEEIESVRMVFSQDCTEEKEPKQTDENQQENISDPEVKELVDKLVNLGYANDKGAHKVKKPYVVSPDEFGERDDYATETLYYYEDGVLADDQDNVIEDVDDIVGADSLNHFGEYEADSVFVRNERYETDYEILMDCRRYSDIANSKLHQSEVE